MADAEDTPAAPAAAVAGGGGGGNKLVMIVSIVNLVASLAIVGLLFVSFKKESSQAKVEDIVATDGEAHGGDAKGDGKAGEHGDAKGEAGKKGVKFGKMIPLEQFTINLSTPGSLQPKFVRVNIALEVPTDDSEQEVGQKMPQVRNAIIDLFNSKRPSDLANPDGREFIKEEIRNTLNSFMVTGKIKGVFFTNFAVTG